MGMRFFRSATCPSTSSANLMPTRDEAVHREGWPAPARRWGSEPADVLDLRVYYILQERSGIWSEPVSSACARSPIRSSHEARQRVEPFEIAIGNIRGLLRFACPVDACCLLRSPRLSCLNGCQCEPHRKTVGIDDRVNLAGQSSVRKSRIDPKIDTSAVQSYINDSFSQEHAPISGFNIFLTDQDTLAT
jgi:hypothetical protein